jgi:hypothetical protein
VVAGVGETASTVTSRDTFPETVPSQRGEATVGTAGGLAGVTELATTATKPGISPGTAQSLGNLATAAGDPVDEAGATSAEGRDILPGSVREAATPDIATVVSAEVMVVDGAVPATTAGTTEVVDTGASLTAGGAETRLLVNREEAGGASSVDRADTWHGTAVKGSLATGARSRGI